MRKKDVVVIMTDQHALHAVSCYGASVCRTPNIDSIAADGIRFERAYTPCALCAPARASFFSGLYPSHHGVTRNTEKIDAEREFFPQTLAKHGYKLGYYGKWHAGVAQTAIDMGFEGVGPRDYGNHAGEHYTEWLAKKGLDEGTEVVEFLAEGELKYACGDGGGYRAGDSSSSSSACIAEGTMDLIERFTAGDQPFLVICSFWGPHAPYYPSSDFKDMYDPKTIHEWVSFRDDLKNKPFVHAKHRREIFPAAADSDWPTWSKLIARYYAFASEIDMQIGRILQMLKDKAIYEDTMLIFMADHGETIGIHGGAFDKGAMAYEEVYRIPFIVKMPGNEDAGSTRSHLVTNMDISATLCDLIGQPQENVHSQSIMPILGDAKACGRDQFMAQFFGHRWPVQQRILWKDQYKYVLNFGDMDELYDLEKDSAEMDNLIDNLAYHAKAKELSECLLAEMQSIKDGHGPQWLYTCERPYYTNPKTPADVQPLNPKSRTMGCT